MLPGFSEDAQGQTETFESGRCGLVHDDRGRLAFLEHVYQALRGMRGVERNEKTSRFQSGQQDFRYLLGPGQDERDRMLLISALTRKYSCQLRALVFERCIIYRSIRKNYSGGCRR